MGLKLLLSKQAGRFIQKLPPKQYKQVVQSVLSLLNDPQPYDSKHLMGSDHGDRRVDVGEYRVIYNFDKIELRILVIGKRNDD